MAHTFNRDELIVRILQKHRIIGEGQAATDGQRAIVDGTIDSGVEELRARGVVNLNVNGAMEVRYKERLAEYLMYSSAMDFSVQPDAAAKEYAEAQLRFIEAQPPTGESVSVDPLFAPSYAAGYPRSYGGGYR